jgi:hypothetical protein
MGEAAAPSHSALFMALSKIEGLVEGNAEGASLPAIASRSGEAGGTPPLIRRRKDQAGSLGTEEKAS